jgi:GNAT superfamily N-acetyltransferase
MPRSTTLTSRVRRIRPDEGARLRALRLRALADAPLAFGSTLAREEAFADEVWDERATRGAAGEDQVTYVAEDEGRWVGMAVGLVDSPDASPLALVGMFVEPDARGRGVGAALVEAVTEWARGRGAAGLSLWVVATNRSAIALYERCGFRPTGRRQPLDHTPALTEIEMIRDLRAGLTT